MAEDQGKEEEKFDFTSEGEGYISLDEARVLALQTASSAPGDYGRSFRGVTMVFEVSSLEETDDFYEVTLSFRPQGNFDGTPGQEQFVVGKEGTVAVRQVLSHPTQTSASSAGTAGNRGGFPILPVAIGLVIVGIIAAVGAVVVLMSSGGDGVLIAAVAPTETPAPTEPAVNIKKTVEAAVQQGLAASATAAPPTATSIPKPTYTPHPTLHSMPTPKPEPTATRVRPTWTPTKPTPTWSSRFQTTPRPMATPDTRTARIVFNRAEMTLKAGHYQGAIDEYTTAIEYDPNYAAAYSGRALAYQSLGQPTLADADKTMACSLDSQYC